MTMDRRATMQYPIDLENIETLNFEDKKKRLNNTI
jgi:hypothetical protein